MRRPSYYYKVQRADVGISPYGHRGPGCAVEIITDFNKTGERTILHERLLLSLKS